MSRGEHPLPPVAARFRSLWLRRFSEISRFICDTDPKCSCASSSTLVPSRLAFSRTRCSWRARQLAPPSPTMRILRLVGAALRGALGLQAGSDANRSDRARESSRAPCGRSQFPHLSRRQGGRRAPPRPQTDRQARSPARTPWATHRRLRRQSATARLGRGTTRTDTRDQRDSARHLSLQGTARLESAPPCRFLLTKIRRLLSHGARGKQRPGAPRPQQLERGAGSTRPIKSWHGLAAPGMAAHGLASREGHEESVAGPSGSCGHRTRRKRVGTQHRGLS